MTDHTLEFLLDFDGRVHWLEQGYWIKFAIARTPPTLERPRGLRYSFTLHDPSGQRLLGFDNAHALPRRSGAEGTRVAHDHWHRAASAEPRPYPFRDAETLLADFFLEVRRVLRERGIDDAVIGVTTRGTRP